MSNADIQTNLIIILSELFKEKGFNIDTVDKVDFIDDWAMDSITFLSLIVEIETKLNIIISDEKITLENFRTYKSVLQIVEDKIHREDRLL